MLTRVSPGQVRFATPGLTADARGVAVGRELALRFLSFDRVVDFLRLLTGSEAFTDLASGARVVFARGRGGGRELVLLARASLPEAAETAAAFARQVGGQAFTGAGRHFVRFRDARAPLGYDVGTASAEAADLVLYDETQTLWLTSEDELALAPLVLRLSLRAEPTSPEALERAARPARCFVIARPGLAPVLLSYLSQRGVSAQAAPVESPADDGHPRSLWLFRVEEPSARVWSLLRRTPGLQVYEPAGARIMVAHGFRHPLNLAACEAVLPSDVFMVFDPPPAGVRTWPIPHFAPVRDLVPLTGGPSAASASVTAAPRAPGLLGLRAAPRAVETSPPAPPAALATPLRLTSGALDGGPAQAVLVPWGRAAWLARVVYAVPSFALREHRVALLEPGVLIVSTEALFSLPFGRLYRWAARGVLVPLGTRLLPAVSPERIEERLATSDGSVVLFPELGRPPVRAPADAFAPLERHVLAQPTGLSDAQLRHRPPLPSPVPAPELTMAPLGPMPLWGVPR